MKRLTRTDTLLPCPLGIARLEEGNHLSKRNLARLWPWLLVLGIVALVTSILPIINNLSFLLAILGIVFAIIGLVGISKGKKSGKGPGIAGLVLSVIAFILVLVMQSAFSAALDQAMEESGLDTATAQGAAVEDSGSATEGPGGRAERIARPLAA